MHLYLLALLFSSNAAVATQFEAIGMNAAVLHSVEIPSADISPSKTVGAITAQILDSAQSQAKLTWQGGDFGVHSINALGSDLEVLSDTQMRAWGWCFSLDGVLPSEMADQVILTPEVKTLRWFYAFAGYENGEWVSYCAIP